MRENVISTMPGTIQDESETAVAENVNDVFGESEADESTYYSDIMEFLHFKSSDSNAKGIIEWAERKWGANGGKCLAIIRKRACYYCLLDGILHHGHENPKPVIIYKNERQQILKELHVQEHTGIHNGVSKMYSSLCTAYFWRGQYGDVKNFVRNCGNCVELPSSLSGSADLPILNSSVELTSDDLNSQSPIFSSLRNCHLPNHTEKFKRNIENRALTCNFEMRDGNEIWKKLELNLLGPYQTSRQGNQYIVVLADPVSRWLSAQPLEMSTNFEVISESAAEFAFRMFCTFGFPRICSIVAECGLKLEEMMPQMEYRVKPIDCITFHMGGKHSKSIHNPKHSDQSVYSTPTLLSLAGISLEQEASPKLQVELNLTTKSSCAWAWELLNKFVIENGDMWDKMLDAFLFEERCKSRASQIKCPFNLMFGRQPFHGAPQDKESVRSKRRKLRRSIFECRHCQENFTSKISFQIHQKKHTEEAQMRGLIDEETSEEHVSQVSTLDLSNENDSQKVISKTSSAEDVPLPSSIPCQKSVHHCSLSGSTRRRKPHVKIGGMKKHYQRGITRLLALAQVSRSLAARGVCEDIPRDSRRANFTAETVASVRASLEAKRKKHTCRGNYQRYSPELREEIAKFALTHGTQQAVCHFSTRLGGKPISQSTVRNFIKAHCSPGGHLSCFRNQDLEEEIGRFSAVAGTEAAIRFFSSRMGREIKRGTVCRLRRAYLKKHPEEVTHSKGVSKKKTESARRKRRFGALLRDEIGRYAAQNGISAAVEHFSEKLLFSVRECTVTKFLKMYIEKGSSKNSLDATESLPAPGVLDKNICMPTQANQTIDMLNTSLDVLASLRQNSEIERLDHGSSVSQLIYNDEAYSGLQQTLHNQQQASDSINAVSFHGNGTSMYSVDQQSTSQVILGQGVPVSFCGSQSVSFHAVHNYPNFEQSSIQVSINSVGVDQSSMLVNMSADAGQQDVPVVNVPLSHVLSPNNSMVLPDHSLIGSHGNSCNSQNDQEVVLPQNETKSDQNCQILHSNHSTTLTTLLPSSSFDHTKNQTTSSSLINHSSESAVSLNTSALTSLQKSIAPGIDSTFYPLSMSTSHSFHVEGNNLNNQMQDPVMDKNPENSVILNRQPFIIGEALLPVTVSLNDQTDKYTSKETQTITVDGEEGRCVNEISIPEEVRDSCLLVNREVTEENVVSNVAIGLAKDFNSVNAPEETSATLEISKEISDGKKTLQSKKSKKKVVPKPKRGNYTFYSPELRARIGRYAAEHGNLQASKHFQEEVGHQIPESTIRGLRDKYVVKQIQVAATAVSSGDCSDAQKQVTALGYAPRGRPMRLGKYDEIVQDCMHELVKSGEKVCSLLAITTARQVLTQYDPSLLEEYGGSIKLNKSWAKSFLKRMGLSSNS